MRTSLAPLSLQGGLAVERMRDRQALRDESLHDELTGLGNRRKANACFEQLEAGDAFLLIDLDHFKRVNDSLGHPAGDAVLQSAATFLSQSLRDGDEAFRIGGEEFLIVLHQVGSNATIAGERLCEAWRDQEPCTTFSVGAAVHRSGRSAKETLASADQALYRAKDAGRDRAMGEEGFEPVVDAAQT